MDTRIVLSFLAVALLAAVGEYCPILPMFVLTWRRHRFARNDMRAAAVPVCVWLQRCGHLHGRASRPSYSSFVQYLGRVEFYCTTWTVRRIFCHRTNQPVLFCRQKIKITVGHYADVVGHMTVRYTRIRFAAIRRHVTITNCLHSAIYVFIEKSFTEWITCEDLLWCFNRVFILWDWPGRYSTRFGRTRKEEDKLAVGADQMKRNT